MARDNVWLKNFFREHSVEYGLLIFYHTAAESQGYMFGVEHETLNNIPWDTNPRLMYMPEKEYLDRQFRKGFFTENLDNCRRTPPKILPWSKYFSHSKAINAQADLNPDNCNTAEELLELRTELIKRWIKAAKPFMDAYDGYSYWGQILPMLRDLVFAGKCLNRTYIELGSNDFKPFIKILDDFYKKHHVTK